MNRVPFAVGEWYHCFTRGVDKRKTFQNVSDYQRFLQILYLANDTEAVHRSNLKVDHSAIFEHPKKKPLVAIGAYCIMSNHFHLLIQETKEGGIARFMQKVGTSYAMYFNIKNERVGNLFVKPFRSKHVDEDEYLRRVAQYIHMNPVEIFDRDWKSGRSKDVRGLERNVRAYQYSSFVDYDGIIRPESAILDAEARDLIAEDMPPLGGLLEEAAEYYREIRAV